MHDTRHLAVPATARALLGVLALACALLVSAAARADFGDCAAAGFLGGVDDRMGGVALPCDEAERFTIVTPAGPRQVRIVYSTADASAGLMDFVNAIRLGVNRSAAALRGIGEGDPGDVTIWASDLAAPEDDVGTTDAATRPLRGGDECVIALYRGGDAVHITAHEFFHCVQYTTEGRAKTDLAAGTWWVEGSAEWFANLAVPGSGNTDIDVAWFDSASRDTALTAMGQESVVFFFWLGERFGPSMVMALMHAMPGSGGEGAQQDALAGVLAEEDFVTFAQAYLDREISQPGGRAIPSSPFPGDIYVWNETHEHTLEAERFVLARFQLEIACGAWSVERRDEDGTWRVSEDEGPWQELPESLSIDGPDPARYRVAAFGTGSEGFAVTLELSRDPCRQCESGLAAIGPDDPAACLIGSWSLVSGGYGAQIEEMLQGSGMFESMTYPDMESVLVISRDGTYSMPGPPEGYEASVMTPDGDVFTAMGTLAMESGGHWSVDGDTLYLCDAGHTATIDLTLIDPDGTLSELRDQGGPDSGVIQRERSFTCSATGLTLVEDIPFSPTVTWEYVRD